MKEQDPYDLIGTTKPIEKKTLRTPDVVGVCKHCMKEIIRGEPYEIKYKNLIHKKCLDKVEKKVEEELK